MCECSPRHAQSSGEEEDLSDLKGEEEGEGVGESVAPVGERVAGQNHRLMDLPHQLVHQLLTVELFQRYIKTEISLCVSVCVCVCVCVLCVYVCVVHMCRCTYIHVYIFI